VTFNQRSIAEILQMIRMLGGLVGLADRAEALARQLEDGLETVRASARRFPRRPRVFFEEWDDPLISGIRWVEELVEIAGADEIQRLGGLFGQADDAPRVRRHPRRF
jgi:iron complex transport system substrate-binding protein